MLFRPAYNALFEVSEVIPPTEPPTYRQWFKDGPITLKRVMLYVMLSKHVAQGRFAEPGTYLFHVYRIGRKITGHLYKFPLNADLDTIAAYLRTINISVEGLTNVTIPIDPRSVDPRLN